MPESPLEFFDGLAWDDDLDAEILADRIGGGVLYDEDVARMLRTTVVALQQRVHRGQFPRMLPCSDGCEPRRWRARDVALLMVGA